MYPKVYKDTQANTLYVQWGIGGGYQAITEGPREEELFILPQNVVAIHREVGK